MEKEKDFSNNMALTQNSKILASDVSGAIKSITRSGTTFTYTTLDGSTGTFTQQDNNTTYSAGTGISISGTTISNTGVTSVNGNTGAVTISGGISAVKGQIGSAWAANSTSMTLPSGGTWFVFNTGSTGYGNTYSSTNGVSNSNKTSGAEYQSFGGTYAGGTTVYTKQTMSDSDGATYYLRGKLAAIRIA